MRGSPDAKVVSEGVTTNADEQLPSHDGDLAVRAPAAHSSRRPALPARSGGWASWTGTPFEPIYTVAARQDYQRSALFFGQLVWYVVMQRPEPWGSGRYQVDGRDIGSRESRSRGLSRPRPGCRLSRVRLV